MSPRRSKPSPRRSGSVARTTENRARHELGQHFLVDQQALTGIAEAAELRIDESVLEVGAGTGELSAELSRRGASVAAVELDESLCHSLRSRFESDPRVRVVCANVLDYSPSDLLSEARLAPPYVVVANIPYYITAPILRHFLESAVQPRRLVLTVQREAAESIAARPGALSLLAVSVQFFATAELLFRLPPQAFRPAPRVESAVIRIVVDPTPRVLVNNRESFFEIVRAGFRQPRKQLHNALSRGIWLPAGEAEPLLREAGIDPIRRAQTLSLEEWKSVYEAYERRREGWRQSAAVHKDGDVRG